MSHRLKPEGQLAERLDVEFFSLLVLIPMIFLAHGSSDTAKGALEGRIEGVAPRFSASELGTTVRPPLDRRLSMTVVSHTEGRKPASVGSGEGQTVGSSDSRPDSLFVEVIVQAP